MKERLFESMVSVRKERAGTGPHLGLGLYIVRQIAEFHGGTASGFDRPDGSGVVLELRLPAEGMSVRPRGKSRPQGFFLVKPLVARQNVTVDTRASSCFILRPEYHYWYW